MRIGRTAQSCRTQSVARSTSELLSGNFFAETLPMLTRAAELI